MEKILSFLASSSDSVRPESLPLPAGNYEVFLSFRGPDLRRSFADCIYSFLRHYGIRTFFDDVDLPKGGETASKLIKAIDESKIYIPIFSPDYAASKWCLMELAHMVKCYGQGKGHLIFPIFFFVDPREVRGLKGSFGKTFLQLAREYDEETVTEWKEALQKVGALKGWHVTESDGQGAIIVEVFSKVRSHLMENYNLVTEELVGIDSHVEQVTNLLKKSVKIVGIHGMSGIGKTSIAKAVYDNVNKQFRRCCFVKDVRETLSGNDGIVTLQNKILSSILGDDTKIKDASQGIRAIEDRVGSRDSVLIVLDDVGERFDFDSTLGDLKNFSSESRFIITTTDERVMELFHQYELYQPGEMGYDDALQLFSRHAFGMDYPPQDYMALSKDFVEAAAGLPLALEAIGSHLFCKGKSFWGEKLTQFRNISPVKVQERLMIIYKELTPEEKQIFLDIACCFIGEHCDLPSFMWSDLDLYPGVVIETLRLKSLIKIDDRMQFWMHDQYKNIGRAIVREDSRIPWKRSRMWSNKDVLDMLRDKEGTDQLEILKVDMKGEDFELTDDEFKKLSGLKYLDVKNGRLTGDFKDILPHVRCLRLDNCTSIPVDFSSKKLVGLNFWRCSIRDDWKGWNYIKVSPKLKVVDVSSCEDLKTAPDLSQCRKLEHLNLQDCPEMKGELHIANFENLKLLKLGHTKITKLIGGIGVLKKVQEIDAGNSYLTEVPADIGKLSSLETLDIRLHMLGSKELPILPKSLKRLYLSSPRVPNLCELKDLEELWFSNCDGPEIPGDLWMLSKLKSLILADCPCESLPVLPSSLNRLHIERCTRFKRLPNFTNLNKLTNVVLTCVQVREIIGLAEVKMLEDLSITDAPNLINLNGLENLVHLKKLYLRSCSVLGSLPSLANLTQLQILVILSCGHLPKIIGLEKLGDSLSRLDISGPSATSALLSLSKLVKLTKLSLDFPFTNINQPLSPELVLDLSSLQCITDLSIVDCKQLTEVNRMGRLESLQSLCLQGCKSVRNLADLSGIKNLRDLNIQRCTQLTEVKGLENLESFAELNMSGCTSMKKLPSLFRDTSSLNVSGCKQLIDLSALEKLESLKLLNMTNCTSICKLPDLSNLKALISLHIKGCIQLTHLPGIEGLESLFVLNMDPKLEEQYGDLLRVKNRRIK
ncbi:Disease resistance protein L6 [Linum grandiflorum]